mgnify:CR=1 FL=1
MAITTFIPELWSARLLYALEKSHIATNLVNRDYEGLIQNHLSKDEYFTFKEKYEAKIEAISKEIEQLKAGLAIIAKQLEQYKMLSQDAQHIKEDRQLTAALIDRLIDRVEVSREKRITVRFRFQSEFEHCEEVLSQCRNM